MSNIIIVGKSDANGELYKFYVDEIHEWGLLGGYCTDVQEVAHILASNTEVPGLDDNGCVEIDPSNFNDSFNDMIFDLTGEDDDEDEDGDNQD